MIYFRKKYSISATDKNSANVSKADWPCGKLPLGEQHQWQMSSVMEIPVLQLQICNLESPSESFNLFQFALDDTVTMAHKASEAPPSL
ncbi:hypothetical protein T4E_10631 [Trichinella pseudospiralis]|uniref:Uncharacterized protein n=1 Tax=Trichinella pseudospiralis TaxID=6337 RepID=A0A0V0XEK7_TRIPS|nr:hypothetical protein T4E_10631 [Trichinella pseudospiralis]